MTKYDYQNALLRTGLVSSRDMIGCSEDEVKDVSLIAGYPLPKAYKEFLFAMGRAAGIFLLGTDIFYRHVHDLKKNSNDLLKECGANFEIPVNAFVFYMHQGYEFAFFINDGIDDPAVYQFIEGNDSPILVWESFTDFFLDMIRVFVESQQS